MQRINVTTRTGKKVHTSWLGSSVTRCGHWLKVQSQHFQIDSPVTCERCLDPTTPEPVAPVATPDEILIQALIEKYSPVMERAVELYETEWVKAIQMADGVKDDMSGRGFSLRNALAGDMTVAEAIRDAATF
jgi:hypothetical protein